MSFCIPRFAELYCCGWLPHLSAVFQRWRWNSRWSWWSDKGGRRKSNELATARPFPLGGMNLSYDWSGTFTGSRKFWGTGGSPATGLIFTPFAGQKVRGGWLGLGIKGERGAGEQGSEGRWTSYLCARITFDSDEAGDGGSPFSG